MQALNPANGILLSISNNNEHFIINLASVTGRQLVNTQMHRASKVIANAMTLLNKIFGRQKADPFDQAPFLIPWYFDKNKPKLTGDNSLLSWKFVDKVEEEYVGIVTLNDNNNNILGLFNAYVYIHPSVSGDTFCVWTRSNNESIGFPTLNINLYFTKNLRPFIDSNKSILQLHSDKAASYLLNSEPVATISIKLNADKESFKVEFPDNFKIFDEFITVTDIPNLYLNGKAEWNNTALVVIKPKDNWVFIYPQDWFNQDEKVDFGYQWITRAVRNKDTNIILGQGIRIEKFELDESGRQLKHWL